VALQRESADNTSATLALSPNVSLMWAEAVHIGPGPKIKLAPSWKGFSPSLCWRWPAAVGAFARDSVVATQQVKQVRTLQFGGAVRGAIHIDEKRKCDVSLFPECARIVKIAHPNRREISSACLDFTLMLAQLRDVLAAKPLSRSGAEKTMTAACDSHNEPRRKGRSSASGRTIADSFALRLSAVICLAPYRQPEFNARMG